MKQLSEQVIEQTKLWALNSSLQTLGQTQPFLSAILMPEVQLD